MQVSEKLFDRNFSLDVLKKHEGYEGVLWGTTIEFKRGEDRRYYFSFGDRSAELHLKVIKLTEQFCHLRLHVQEHRNAKTRVNFYWNTGSQMPFSDFKLFVRGHERRLFEIKVSSKGG